MDYKIKLKQLKESCLLTKIPEDAHGFLTTEISRNFSNSDLIFIAENGAEMEIMQKQIHFFAPHLEILLFPAWDCLPFDRASPKQSILANRIKTLHRLTSRPEGKKFFIITSLHAILQKTLAPKQIKDLGLYLQIGSKISPTQIAEFLTAKSYSREACANNVGEFALRGGIVDIVMQQAADLVGYRLDFFGNELESIKTFDPITQISEGAVKSLEILPASEVMLSEKTVENFRQNYRNSFGSGMLPLFRGFERKENDLNGHFQREESTRQRDDGGSLVIEDPLYNAISEMRSYSGMEHWLPFFYEENLVSFLDYLQNPVAVFDQKIFDLAEKRQELISEYYQARVAETKIPSGITYNPIAPNLLYFSADELRNSLNGTIAVQFNINEPPSSRLRVDSIPLNRGNLEPPSSRLRVDSLPLKMGEHEPSASRILDLEMRAIPDFALAGRANQKDPIDLMKEFILANPSAKKIIIACLTEAFRSRIAKIFLDYGIACAEIENFSEAHNVKAGKAAICVLPTHFGFYSSDLMLIGEQAIFGEKIIRKKTNKAASQRLIEEGLSINIGELVVHRDHGIGKFDGLKGISAVGVKCEMIKLIYGGGDVLFVPVDEINLISRYGTDNALIQLDRLGGGAWKNRRENVRKKIKIAAEELLKIAAARHLKKAPIFVPDQHFYDEFKSRFGFVATEDQVRAIEEVEQDLQKGSPMDRLICGDVGFGKTEVAMRATAMVVGSPCLGASRREAQRSATMGVISDTRCHHSPLEGESKQSLTASVGGQKLKVRENSQFSDPSPNATHSTLPQGEGDLIRVTIPQVAIIAPTTLLVRQHYKNFTKRFEQTGVKIAQLSRLISTTEAKKTRDEIEAGSAQIIIGTHALLQKSIKFKNLALVIIDEEQHFGVAQKERLKEMRNEVHVLTLSATPIPRSLQMSLTGVKDLSLIATPPLDRLATRNFVMPYDSVIVREAVMREYNRGGRVFFVVPRISDIEEMEARLKILLPEIKITHAHGQMTPSQLDKIMNDFVDGKIDMLLSTTIIESGIDISDANTIIIYKAEMFGLAQLYQLRGRVGRGKLRAYAYFMLDNRKKVSADSRKKLEVMQSLDSLGIGFTVASHDMDIRGSGNLLGGEQSGHVRETGVELYQQLLLETIEGLKNGQTASSNVEVSEEISVQIKLGISLLIPEDYMQDLSLRMSFYKKITNIKNDEDQENLMSEMIDRFGKIPGEILNLMEIAKLKWACRKVDIAKIEAIAEGILVSFQDNKFAAPERLLQMVFASKNQIKIHVGQKVLFVCDVKSTLTKISSAFQTVKKLQSLLL